MYRNTTFRLNEIQKIRKIVTKSGVGLTAKIGGCEALTDLRLAYLHGSSGIMAPMIESRFALEKYLEMCSKEFLPEELDDIDLQINIETKDSLEKIDDILPASNIDMLHCIVLGRTDLCKNYAYKDVNDRRVLNLAIDLFSRAKNKSIKCIIGGGTTIESIPFFTALGELIDGFETRKVVFGNYRDYQKNLKEGKEMMTLCQIKSLYHMEKGRSEIADLHVI